MVVSLGLYCRVATTVLTDRDHRLIKCAKNYYRYQKLYENLESLQADLDEWLEYYNRERTHQGKMCCGRTPWDTLIDGKQIWQEKYVN
jgi:hypothetical protein